MDFADVKTIEDLDRALDVRSLPVFSGRKYYTIEKVGRFQYLLHDGGAATSTPYTDLGALLAQLTVMLMQDCD